MSKKERELVKNVRDMADALLKSKKHQEYAARYLLGVSMRQLQRWHGGDA